MFIVIEGIDGAGCETQAVNLQKLLHRENHAFAFLKYPNYEANVGKFIKEYLYNNKDISVDTQFLLYSLQFISDSPFIKKERQEKIVIADRYFSTTLCFQTLQGIRMDKALRFAEDFHIEKPDMILYLNVHPDIAIKRKSGEKKAKNRTEKDFDNIWKTYRQYETLLKNQIWTKWVDINGEKTVDEVTMQIFDIIKNNS